MSLSVKSKGKSAANFDVVSDGVRIKRKSSVGGAPRLGVHARSEAQRVKKTNHATTVNIKINNMSLSVKSKGKMAANYDVSDGVRIKRKSSDGGEPNLDVHARSEAQRVKNSNRATKVPKAKSRNEATNECKMVWNNQQLYKYEGEIMVMKKKHKPFEEVVSSVEDKLATLELSVIQLQQHMMGENFKGSYASASKAETWQFQDSKELSDPFICEICAEPNTGNDLFSIKGCSHAYCKDCMVKYVTTKLHENITSILCPVVDCGGLLEPEYCRDILPQDVFDRWGAALCEATIPGAQKFYCPFKDCSAMLINDGKEFIRESECPNCRRLFCARCNVPWHSGIECIEFQKLNKDEREREDILLMKVAQKKNWKRCPNCRYYIEKKDGCLYMKCRCGTAFCYNCGAPSDNSNQYHYCTSCKH